jgi:uncharacterized glyoxalase superfamily protein PhnB
MNPYLSFRGDCEAAFRFYERTLDGQLGSIFHQLVEGGQVVVPLARTFWAERFGMVIDRFGIPWSINYEGSGQPAAV